MGKLTIRLNSGGFNGMTVYAEAKLPADGYYADDWALINIAQHLLDEDPNEFTFIAHGASDGIGLDRDVTRGVLSPEEFAEKLSKLMPGVTIIAPNAFVVINSRKYWHVIADTQLLLRSENDVVTGNEQWLKFKN